MKTKSIRHFTLVELLTVVVVMTILGSITIPLYNRLMTGSAVSYANRLVNSQLNMARVHACRKRKPVAVLFADYGLTWKSSLDDVEKLQFAQRAFRCAYVKPSTTTPGDWDFDCWVEGSKWEFLPRGAFFTFPVPTGGTEANFDEHAVHNYTSPKSEEAKKGLYPVNSAGYSVKTVTDDEEHYFDDCNFKFAIIFQENGRPVEVSYSASVSSTPRVRIAEGIVSDVSNANGATVVKYNPYNYMISTVNRYTGAVSTKAPEIE